MGRFKISFIYRIYVGSSDVSTGTGHTEKVVLHLRKEKLDNVPTCRVSK